SRKRTTSRPAVRSWCSFRATSTRRLRPCELRAARDRRSRSPFPAADVFTSATRPETSSPSGRSLDLHRHGATCMTAYLIADIDIHDDKGYEDYRRRVPAIIASYGGRYLVRGSTAEVLEGDYKPARGIVIEFPKMAAAKRFLAPPEYRPLRAIRQKCARTNLIAFEGVVAPSP